MNEILSFLVAGSFVSFLAVVVALLLYGADKTLKLLGAHLERLHTEFDAMHDQQEENNKVLLTILAKLIILQGGDKSN